MVRSLAFCDIADLITLAQATYLADRVVVYEGQPSVNAFAKAPTPLVTGMNAFLKSLNITFRRDPDTKRPR